MNKSILSLSLSLFTLFTIAQKDPGYWQQHISYKMNVDVDVTTYRYNGTSEVTYTNNSPDTLDRVFFHLYFNAFQPGSDMDARLQSIPDPDSRMVTENKQSRIANLTPDQIGYLNVSEVRQNGSAALELSEEETILVVRLANPIAP